MNTSAFAPKPPSKGLSIALWIIQAFLALGFLASGLMKLTTPIEKLTAMMPWVSAVPGLLVRFIGLAEILGAVGLVLPALTRIRPRLTPWAAIGLLVIMLLAVGFHATRGELQVLGAPVVFGGMPAFVAWGRFRKAPFSPRS